MQKISYNTRVYLKPNGLVMVRVRWKQKQNECYFSLGIRADAQKWNAEAQHARKNTTHNIDGDIITAREINECIDDALADIKVFFNQSGLAGHSPTKAEFSSFIAQKLGKPIGTSKNATQVANNSFKEIFERFLREAAIENNWGERSHHKYVQAYKILMAYKSKITLRTLNKKELLGLKEFMIEKGHHNYGINRHFRNIRTIARWAKENGEEVSSDIFTFKTKLSAPRKTIVYLTMEEIEQFYNFQFPEDKGHLAKARDLFVFMCH